MIDSAPEGWRSGPASPRRAGDRGAPPVVRRAGGRRLAPLGGVVSLVLFAASGCVSTARPAPTPAGPVFDPVAFFAGRTEGRGILKVALHRRVTTLVEGRGRVDSAGTITLDQTVRRGNEAPTRRTWRLTRVGPDRYTGTLSDAAGPVTGDVRGGRLHLHFRMKGGLAADQWLVLEPSGTVARNVLLIAKLGVTVARLDETITRLP